MASKIDQFNMENEINKNKCMARLKKDPSLQCKNSKKCGDFCKLHENTSIQFRIDWNSDDIKMGDNIDNYKYVDISQLDIINRFNIKQLKNTIKHYNIKCNVKSKKDIINSIKIYFQYTLKYNNNIDKIIKIQRYLQKYKFNNVDRLRGDAFNNRSLCTNDNDFLTFISCSEIDNNNFVSFRDNKGFHYGFDIKSLYQIIKNGSINPYNREKILESELHRINNLFKLLKLKNIELDIDNNSLLNPKEKTFQRIINIFKMIDDLGYYTQVNWFLNLNINELKNYYIQAEDIWNYRAYELTPQIKKNIVYPDGKCFYKLHKIQLSYDLNEIRNLCLDDIERLINTSKNISDKKMGAMYSLSALVIVSYDAGCSLPWLLDSVL